MQGIDTILSALANASGALERTARPGIKEFKEAAAAAKLAADLLKASETFLANGIYVICDEPASAYVDPVAHKIEMPEVREELVAQEVPAPGELLPLPDLLGDFDQLHPEAQAAAFESHLESLFLRTEHGPVDNDPLIEWAAPWRAAFAEGRLDAYARLVYALDHRQPTALAFPDDEEMRTWREQFAQPLPPLPDDLVHFDSWDEVDAQDEFSRRLDALDVRLDKNLRASEANFAPWDALWDQDHKDAFTRLLAAEAREDVSNPMLLPTEAERDLWLAQFAAMEPTVHEPSPCCDLCGQTAVHSDDCAFEGAVGQDEEAVEEPASPKATMAEFQALLDELEERGVESGQKRKNWKKANKAWWSAFDVNPLGTFSKLQKLLDRQGCTWDIPEDEIETEEEEAI